MFTATARKIGGIVVLVWATSTSPALADVAPDPERPIDWNERPLPQPDPPPEKELVHALVLCGAALLVASCVGKQASRRALEAT